MQITRTFTRTPDYVDRIRYRAGPVGNVVHVTDPEAYSNAKRELNRRMTMGGGDSTQRRLMALTQYEALCDPKGLVPFPEDSLEAMQTLTQRYPNAASLLQQVTNFVYLGRMGEVGHACLPPLLLVGEPGSGKTSVAKAIARCISPHVEYIDFSSTGEAFYLAGLDMGYSTGQAGRIADMLYKAKYANFTVVVDEFDKGAVEQKDRPSAYAVMHELLEPQTSRRFEDAGLRVCLDCSWINWIFTANDLEEISDSLKSRCVIFRVDAPTREQLPVVIQSIWDDLRGMNAWGSRYSAALAAEVTEALSYLTPREVVATLRQAAANAAARVLGNGSVKVSEGEVMLRVTDLPKLSRPGKRPIGFIAPWSST